MRKDGEEIARLGPGEIIGEVGIVNHKLRSASIVTLDKAEVLHFTSEDLRKLCDDVPSFKDALDRAAQERLGS